MGRITEGCHGIGTSIIKERENQLEFFRPHLNAVELIERLGDIASNGWHRTVTSGPTGVGLTLEGALGIRQNSTPGPDVGGIELKAKRQGVDSGALVTLFAKTPDWSSISRVELLDAEGDADKNGRWSLYTSVPGDHESSSGWRLEFVRSEKRLYACRHGRRVIHWRDQVLEKRLHEKHTETFFVTAEARGKGNDEEFRYVECVHAKGMDYERFRTLVQDGGICFDFAMHRKPDGSVRDHGFLFRIRKNRITDLFEHQVRYVF